MENRTIQLIRAVSRIDHKAARWIETEAHKLEGYDETGKLSTAFPWNQSPQGHKFWVRLHKKLPVEYQ